uniref:Uncharacterized protein n=1 Tax=Schizaphis graminum TaxID=13262 RepID=A0A2S2PUR9_SCHGA
MNIKILWKSINDYLDMLAEYGFKSYINYTRLSPKAKRKLFVFESYIFDESQKSNLNLIEPVLYNHISQTISLYLLKYHNLAELFLIILIYIQLSKKSVVRLKLITSYLVF